MIWAPFLFSCMRKFRSSHIILEPRAFGDGDPSNLLRWIDFVLMRVGGLCRITSGDSLFESAAPRDNRRD